jgi:tetratricopeptide (TPR) repeat protein
MERNIEMPVADAVRSLSLMRRTQGALSASNFIVALLLASCACALGQSTAAAPLQTILAVQQQIEAGNLDQARSMISDAGKKYPHDGGLLNLLGVIEIQQGNESEARKDFSAAIQYDRRLTSAYMNLSRIDMRNAATDTAQRAEALAVSEKAATLDPGNDEANYQIATILAWDEKYRLSLAALKKLSSNAQSLIGAQSLMCADLAMIGNRDDATKASAVLAANPDLSEQDANTCVPALRRAHRADLITAILGAADAREPLSAPGLRTLGLAEEADGKLPEARTALERAYAADVTQEIVLEDLARVAKAVGDEKGALGYLAHAREMRPDDPELPYEFGAICLHLGLYGESRKALAEAVRIAPENPQYNLGLGTVISFSQDPSQALPYLTKFHALRPQDPAGVIALGTTYFRAKDYDTAATWLKQVTSDTKNSAEAYFYLGRIAREEGHADEAIDDLNKSLAARPDQPDVLAELGQISVTTRNFAQAAKYLNRAIQLEPENYPANFGLLELFARTGDPRREQQSKRFEEIKNQKEQWNRDVMRVLEIRPSDVQKPAKP